MTILSGFGRILSMGSNPVCRSPKNPIKSRLPRDFQICELRFMLHITQKYGDPLRRMNRRLPKERRLYNTGT